MAGVTAGIPSSPVVTYRVNRIALRNRPEKAMLNQGIKSFRYLFIRRAFQSSAKVVAVDLTMGKVRAKSSI